MIPTGVAAQISDDLRLKLEKQMRMAPPSRPERDTAKFLEADRIVGDADRNVVATGNVTLRQRGAVIRAGRDEDHDADQTVVATGAVRLDRDGDVAAGPRLNYHLDNDTGEMDSPAFEFPKRPERRAATRGHASRAVLEENQISRLFQAEYTSCPVPRDDWFIRVRELEIDAPATSAPLTTPPYFFGATSFADSCPLDNKRKSGFADLRHPGKSGSRPAAVRLNIAEDT